jgi:uncharacterized protein (DUF2235 family)
MPAGCYTLQPWIVEDAIGIETATLCPKEKNMSNENPDKTKQEDEKKREDEKMKDPQRDQKQNQTGNQQPSQKPPANQPGQPRREDEKNPNQRRSA